MNFLKYPTKSWIDHRVEIRASPLGGKGLFTCKTINKGEVVIIWGGTLFTEESIKAGRARLHSIVEIGENKFLAGKKNELESIDDFLNHSCDPNLWLKDEIALIARRNIVKGEELTADYGTWVSRLYWKMECRCGSHLCRHEINGNDWKLKQLHRRYKDHFSPYLNKRISQLKKG